MLIRKATHKREKWQLLISGCNLVLSTVTDNRASKKGCQAWPGLACLTCRWYRSAHNLLTFTSNLPWERASEGHFKVAPTAWETSHDAGDLHNECSPETTAELRKFEAINVRYSTVNAIGQWLCYGAHGTWVIFLPVVQNVAVLKIL